MSGIGNTLHIVFNRSTTIFDLKDGLLDQINIAFRCGWTFFNIEIAPESL